MTASSLCPAGGAECLTLQHTAAHCSTLQHTATQCSTLQHTATHCNTLHPTAHTCNTLQHRESGSALMTQELGLLLYSTLQHTATHCSTLQHTATRLNTLHPTAPPCNTLHRRESGVALVAQELGLLLPNNPFSYAPNPPPVTTQGDMSTSNSTPGEGGQENTGVASSSRETHADFLEPLSGQGRGGKRGGGRS